MKSRRIYIGQVNQDYVYIIKKGLIDLINDLAKYRVELEKLCPECINEIEKLDIDEIIDKLILNTNVREKVSTYSTGRGKFIYLNKNYNIGEEIFVMDYEMYREVIKYLIKNIILYGIHNLIKQAKNIEKVLTLLNKTKESLRNLESCKTDNDYREVLKKLLVKN